MGILAEFKEFAVRGNVIDLAVGVVIGAAFGKIVTALVENLIMPFIGLLTGGIDFSRWAITLREAQVNAAGEEVPALVLGIGNFVNTIVQFVIVAFAIFIAVKFINSLKRKHAEQPAENKPVEPSEEVKLLREIRDALRSPDTPVT
ncbi:large-conductance mechanosensitive channel protein MscL [Luteimonas sp. FCS-9]|uniref:large-conductance mechanosensitive channel protein MscL n=1 Tax=Luteimonas sp. FCS-9 TaxID=1547516 RepID=UPI00063E971F|nr:large-conductance mechanosensitive channel protein MscL [Luteimonas sp. FCS-9]KLJ00988.1 mechanosensitive ion channel protein MscL [Luteimonas sp. FCS-9]